MIKKFITYLTGILMVSAMTIVSIASDVPSSWAQEEVNQAIKLGYVPNELQGNYQDPITREEFATLFVTAIFSDINDTNSRKPAYMKEAWHFSILNSENFLSKVKTNQKFVDTDNEFVKVANMLGIINGNSATTFNPTGKITREQVAIMIANYVQTNAVPSRKEKEGLEDFGVVSNWARQGVAFTYEAALMNGLTKPEYDVDGGYKRKGIFGPKDLLTREQAIIIIYRLGREQRDYLDEWTFRGFVYGNMDILMSGIDIVGDTVKLKEGSYHNRYTDLNKHLDRRGGDFITYIDTYNSEKLNSLLFSPPGPSKHMFYKENIEPILEGRYAYFNYGAYTVEYNKDGYLAVTTKINKDGFFAFGAYLMYGDIASERGAKKVELLDSK